MKNKKLVLIIAVALIVGFGVGLLTGRAGETEVSVTQSHNMDSMMGDMAKNLEGRTGSDFERAFLEDMIVHHEGAINMAELVLKNTKRPELLQMAEGIISVQNIEIDLMRQWRQEWFDK